MELVSLKRVRLFAATEQPSTNEDTMDSPEDRELYIGISIFLGIVVVLFAAAIVFCFTIT